MAKAKYTTSREREQARNKRRVERNKILQKQAAVLSKAGILPAGISKLVAIPKAGRSAMTPEQRTARRKAAKLAPLADRFATPDGKLKPKHERMVLKTVTREQAAAGRKAGMQIIQTPAGPAILDAPAPRLQGTRLTKQFSINASALVENEDGEFPLLDWLEAQFAKLKPGESLGFMFSVNENHVSTVQSFHTAEGMLYHLRNKSYAFAMAQDVLGSLVVVPIPKMQKLKAETARVNAMKARTRRKQKRKPSPPLSDYEKKQKREYDRARYAARKAKAKAKKPKRK